jgi:EAL domain-containing protein (putative c-di-GMP-specific phosphodiesterase class I)
VAEGIERPEERDALLQLGCRFGQGYLFAPGLPEPEASRLLGVRLSPASASSTVA